MSQPLSAQVTDEQLRVLYGEDPAAADRARARIDRLVELFEKTFAPVVPTSVYTSAGRTELGGNHTDHQHGRGLAASVDWDVLAVASRTDGDMVHVASMKHGENMVKVGDWEKDPTETGKSNALLRGVCRAFVDRGYPITGVCIASQTDVPGGSGMSSSAAYEVLLATIFNHLFANDELSPIEIAQIGQYAENEYLGKPSGLLDQLACAVGGVIEVDFKGPANPKVEASQLDVREAGYTMFIIDSGASHSRLTDDYAAITNEMGAVAEYFGATHLVDVDPEEFWADLPGVRAATSDRAVLRAMHFFDENPRVHDLIVALREKRWEDYLDLVNALGESSEVLLQNIFSAQNPTEQPVGVAIAVARRELKGRGAVRVHGGGFAGTVQAYVPNEQADSFQKAIDAALGEGSCKVARIRPVGAAVLVP